MPLLPTTIRSAPTSTAAAEDHVVGVALRRVGLDLQAVAELLDGLLAHRPRSLLGQGLACTGVDERSAGRRGHAGSRRPHGRHDVQLRTPRTGDVRRRPHGLVGGGRAVGADHDNLVHGLVPFSAGALSVVLPGTPAPVSPRLRTPPPRSRRRGAAPRARSSPLVATPGPPASAVGRRTEESIACIGSPPARSLPVSTAESPSGPRRGAGALQPGRVESRPHAGHRR